MYKCCPFIEANFLEKRRAEERREEKSRENVVYWLNIYIIVELED
jgi:hypothetical protein